MAEQLSTRNFGLIIAYVVPGFTAVCGPALHSELLAGWLAQGDVPQVGGLFFITLASIAVGMVLSAVRWAVVDWLHHVSGVRPARFDDARLVEHLESYVWIVENHYRYHQFYGQMFLALVFSHVMWRTSGHAVGSNVLLDAALVAIDVVLFAGSRNALHRYYRRTESLLQLQESEESMTNGGMHDELGSVKEKKQSAAAAPKPKPTKRPTTPAPEKQGKKPPTPNR